MSTYQYYDFCSIDRPLTAKEQQEVGGLSSRSEPTSRRATFEYHYSDFRHDQKTVLRKYFDMMLYVANWGTWQLMIKLPIELVSWDELIAYEHLGGDYEEQYIRFEKSKTHVIIEFYYTEEEGGEWMDAEGDLDGLLSLREQILKGDYRLLYIAWLHIASVVSDYDDEYEEDDYEEEEKTQPPMPANMNKLGIALENFIKFWSINKDLITAAAKNSPLKMDKTDAELSAQIIRLSEEEKNNYLKLLITDDAKVKYQLKKRLAEFISNTPTIQEKSRPFKAIQKDVEKVKEKRLKKEHEEAERVRIKALEETGKRQVAIWREAEYNAEFKSAKGYDQATDALKRLSDYAIHADKKAEFENKLEEFLEKYGKSIALRRRLKDHRII